ncbi:MAG: hypothetical protein IKW59_09320 [Clostridia bacterium]|nr:hypothetical protein [Clostridia bacterium]
MYIKGIKLRHSSCRGVLALFCDCDTYTSTRKVGAKMCAPEVRHWQMIKF